MLVGTDFLAVIAFQTQISLLNLLRLCCLLTGSEADCMFLALRCPAVNQTASAIPKTWRKPNEGISAGEAPQKEDEVRREARSHHNAG